MIKAGHKFAKLFIVDGLQVIVRRDIDDDQDPIIKMTTCMDGVYLSASLGFNKLKEQKEAFRNYNKENAKNFINGLKDLMNG